MKPDGDRLVIRRALLSVADKTGIVELAQRLYECGVELLSTGGTAAQLRAAAIEVKDVAKYTGCSPALGGRLKTLHPALLGGILFDRDNSEQVAELNKLGGQPIDLVVVNYYPFADALSAGKALPELVELIDIGGPTMVRSAAKNHRHVLVLVDPADYVQVADEIKRNAGAVSRTVSRQLAVKAFARNVGYEQSIACGIASQVESGEDVMAKIPAFFGRLSLRYGENPHQAGAVGLMGERLVQHGGGELSYNNLQDAIVAWRAANEHTQPCCAIIKHAVPCGVAVADQLVDAYAAAVRADPVSAYGGVIACNRQVDNAVVDAVFKQFAEVLIAPEFTAQATKRLNKTKRLKALCGPLASSFALDGRIFGGLTLYQSRDTQVLEPSRLSTVTQLQADDEMVKQLQFAWRVAKYARSNAVVISRGGTTLGIGAGQTSRLEAAQLAVDRAKAKGFDLRGAVAASDAFFPFADGLEVLARAGINAVIQPGGAKRDNEVVAAADVAGMVMIFTGLRHFCH